MIGGSLGSAAVCKAVAAGRRVG